MKSFNLIILAVLMSFYSLCGQSIIPSNPNATLQGTLYGVIIDCVSGYGVPYVTVKATGSQQFVTEANASGFYEMLVEDGVYDVEFTRIGYDTIVILDTTVVIGSMTEISVHMCEYPYPVQNVVGTLNETGNEFYITWDPPMSPYEIIYDDGEADDYAIWVTPGGAVAVRFTPVGYPATATGGRIYVGDGSFPSGGSFLGSEMAVGVIDDDGVDGFPGTILDSIIITVDNYGWVDYHNLFDVTFEEGDFYLVMWQLGNSTNSAPVGVDTDMPTVYQSYHKTPVENTWSLSSYQDFMIRAYLERPSQTVVGYTIARVSNFDPCLGPETGTLTPIANPTVEYYQDIPIGGIQPGIYAWAVNAIYTLNVSVWEYSNLLIHPGETTVTFNISLCDSASAENSIVTMKRDTCQFITYQFTADSNGIATIDTLLNGRYDIAIDHIGYEVFEMDSVFINSDTTFNIELMQIKYPPRNMYVDSLTNIATWDEPLVTALPLETFEDPVFPPEGWQESYTAERGWFRTDNANYPEVFVVPPGDGYYAVGATDLSSSVFHPLDYLITPQVDLRESSGFSLIFDQYYANSNWHWAYVEYSYDNGVTWDTIEQMSAEDHWVNVEVDLSGISGAESLPVCIAFHSSDHNEWGSGWAVDNVRITADPTEIQSYYVYLDGYFQGQTPANERNYFFDNLVYGENYTACVKALYECGLSEQDCYSWQSAYLKPPNNFQDEYVYNTYEVPLKWNPPLNYFSPNGLVSFNVYLDDIIIDSVPYEGQGHNDWIYYLVDSTSPGNHVFGVTAVYELSIYGLPGEFDESPQVRDTVEVIWGNSLPFFEDWNTQSYFNSNWIIDDTVGNWRINESVGNPEPCAEFYWQPQIIGQYESSLSSIYIRTDSISEGNIYLDFDLRLWDRNITGNEKMSVEVYDGSEWHEVALFVNNGPILFTNYSFDITDIITQAVFQIRFRTMGENTKDIIAWYIDNISIYRVCEPPTDLTGRIDWFAYDDPAIKISWEGPFDPGPIAEWIYWDSGVNYSGIASSDILTAAVRWDADQLAEYEGTSITKVQYYMYDDFNSIILKVWTGANAGTLIYEEDVTTVSTQGIWNEVSLVYPIPLNVVDELWVGYTVMFDYGTFPAGVDAGPAVIGYGDMINSGGSTWDPLSSFGLNYNWNIEVFLENMSSSKPPIPISNSTTYSPSISELKLGPVNENPVRVSRSGSRSMHGYYIYRMDDNTSPEYILYDSLDYVFGQMEYCYFDTIPNVNLQDGYYYKVTANWKSDIDNCESEPAMALEIPEDDFVYIFLEDVFDVVTDALINVYPNPAKDFITVKSTLPMNHISVTNYVGQVVYSSSMNETTSIVLNTSSYKTGVYLVEVKTSGGVSIEKIMIAR